VIVGYDSFCFFQRYAEDFVHDLASTLKDNLPRDQADTAEQLARAYARNDPDAEDKVEKIFENASTFLDMDKILDRARASKAEELTEKYGRRDPDAGTRANMHDKKASSASSHGPTCLNFRWTPSLSMR
jgi:hypothetical protein